MGVLFGTLVPMRVKVKEEERDMTAATGSIAYTGYGFRPQLVIINATMAVADVGDTASWGSSTGYIQDECIYLSVDGNFYETIAVVVIFTDAGKSQSGIVQSLDDDGLTIYWTKAGLPLGTMKLKVTVIG